VEREHPETIRFPGDTVVEVRRGDSLVLTPLNGTVVVDTWDRPEMRAETGRKAAAAFEVRRSGSRVELRLNGRSSDREDDLRITLPPWMNLVISGRELDAEVRGISGEVTIRSLEGDLFLEGLSGPVEAYAVEGSIEAAELSGSAHLRTGDDDITVLSSTAVLGLESVEGDIDLVGVRAPSVRVQTTDGDVGFTGRFQPGGDYRFFSHSGEIRLSLEPPVNVQAEVLAYEGEFESDFSVRAEGFRSGEGMRFILGEGGATLVVETFDGDIRLLRASSIG